MSSDSQIAVLHAIAGGIAGASSLTLLYPLDFIRSSLQMKQTKYKGTLDCARKIMKEGGVSALYRGVKSAAFGCGVSSVVYFYWYSLFKNMVLRTPKARQAGLTPYQNLLIASVAGAVNVTWTMPLWTVNARLRLNKFNSVRECINTIVEEDGVCGLWRGLVASLCLVSNPAIQFAVYEQLLKTLQRLKNRKNPSSVQLNAVQYFVIGAIGKAVATVLTYPYQVVKQRVSVGAAADGRPYNSTTEAFMRIWREEGMQGLFGGLQAKLGQTVLTAAFMFVFYEKVFQSLDKLTTLVRREEGRVTPAAQPLDIPDIPVIDLNTARLVSQYSLGGCKPDVFTTGALGALSHTHTEGPSAANCPAP